MVTIVAMGNRLLITQNISILLQHVVDLPSYDHSFHAKLLNFAFFHLSNTFGVVWRDLGWIDSGV